MSNAQYLTNGAGFVKKTVSQFEQAGREDALSFFEPAVSFLLRKTVALRSRHPRPESSLRRSESFLKRQKYLTSENESKRYLHAREIDSVFSYKTSAILMFCFFIAIAISPSSAEATNVFLFPVLETTVLGESAVYELRIDTQGETVNAIELHGGIVGNTFAIKKLETSGSLFSVFPEPPSFSRIGFSFYGAVPNGFKGQGIIGRLIVLSSSVGEGSVTIATSSRVFLNDGRNSLASLSLTGGKLKVIPKDSSYIALSSTTHKDQNRWLSGKLFRIDWNVLPGESYSYVISRLPTEEPDAISDTPIGSIQFQNLDDGIYYFSVCLVKNGGCGAVSTFRAMIDATPPEWVSVGLDAGAPETGGKPSISFLARDIGAGMERYEISLNNEKNYATATSPYILPDNFKGQIVIIAYDVAGNFLSKKVVVGDTKSASLKYILPIFILLLFILVLWISRRLRKNKHFQYNK
ncbi:MAG TPA: hypothetical protein VJK04_03215 [Candidatus Paceibacterota bacterium]